MTTLLANRFMAWCKDVDIPVEYVSWNTIKLLSNFDDEWVKIDLGTHPDLASSNQTLALQAFQTITNKHGWGKPEPTNRVGKPSKAASFKEDEFLVMGRHNEFRQSHNPDPAKFTIYKPILKARASRFWFHNAILCRSYGMEFEDVMQYAYVWLVNFCGMYELPEANRLTENKKILQNYLKQRFAELQTILTKKNKCIYANLEMRADLRDHDPRQDFADLMDAFELMDPKKAKSRLKVILRSGDLDTPTKKLAREWLAKIDAQAA